MLQEGSCIPTSSGERKSLGNKDEILSQANERRSRCTYSFLNLAFLPFHTLFLSAAWILRGKPFGMEKARSSLSSLLHLVKSLSSQENHIEFILACVLSYWGVWRAQAMASPSPPAPQAPMPRRGPLLLLSVTLHHAHRWCCCCSARRVLLSNTIPPQPLEPTRFPQPSTAWLLFHQRLLYCSLPQINFVALFFPQCHLLPLPPVPALLLSLSLFLSLSPSLCRIYILQPNLKSTLFPTVFLYLVYLWHLTGDSPNEKGL